MHIFDKKFFLLFEVRTWDFGLSGLWALLKSESKFGLEKFSNKIFLLAI